jgi:hypothetical protein
LKKYLHSNYVFNPHHSVLKQNQFSMPNTIDQFKKFNRKGSIRVSKARKVGHSLSNRLRANTGRANLAADTTLNVAGAAGTGAAVAVIAGAASVGAAAALTGVGFAAVVGIIGIVKLGYDMTSNRDGAHEKLSPYVFSYIDRTQPRALGDIRANKEAKGAAMSLIVDGYAQQKLQERKLEGRVREFNGWVTDYNILSRSEITDANNKKRMKHITKGFNQNGAIWELMRRLNHKANYLQAYTICAKVFQNDASPLEDIPKGNGARYFRKYFREMATVIDKDNKKWGVTFV